MARNRNPQAQPVAEAQPDDESPLRDEQTGYTDAEDAELDGEAELDDGGSGGEDRPRRRRRGGGGGDDGGGDLTPHPSASPASAPRRRNGLVAFAQGSWRELQRVQWPDRRQVVQATGVVIGFVIVAGAYLGLADWVAGRIVHFILS